ncbi:MAG: hypothetical protein IKX89_07485 [Firmicutes bacterium]|nr:hypothetical protein [Bacillota bacterium]
MGLINLIKYGFFSALFDFSVPAKSAGAWACLLAGAAVQIILNRKAKKPEQRFIFVIIMAIVLLILEFAQYSRLFTPTPAFQYIYGLTVCLLIGLAVPAVIFWMRGKRTRAAEGSVEHKAAEGQDGKID